MDIRKMYYFKEIVEQGSISRAAKVLHIAQPPLSQLLKRLETELDTTLIKRYRQKWELTETGELLYQYATQMLTRMQGVKEHIQEIEQGSLGTVRIGVSSSCSNMLIDYVSIYRMQFPNVKISIMSSNTDELLKRLEQREIDVALLLRTSNSKPFVMKALKKQPYVVIIPTNWASSFPSERVTFKEIGEFPFIMLGAMEGHSFNDDILKAFESHQVQPNIIIECKDISMVVALVSKGVGLSVIPKMDYTPQLLEQTTFLALEQFDLSVEPVIVKLKDQQISKAANQFWDIVH